MSKLFEMLIEDAKEDAVIEVAKSMLNDNFPISVITKHTGLSDAAIRDIQINIKKEPVTVG